MSYTLTTTISLGSSRTGLTLSAQLVNSSGATVGGLITTGFIELGGGHYMWTYAAFPAGFRGAVKFTTSSSVQAVVSINPQEVENPDVLTSTRTSLGPGATTYVHNVLVPRGSPEGVDVWVTETSSPNTQVIASGRTDQVGNITFRLDAGTYYFWHQKPGVNFPSDPSIEVVS